MTRTQINNWQAVQDEVLRRIHAREWKPGDLIPNEADLAQEFGCARATVNRALRSLADSGMLDRRRKAGTRIAKHPVSKATLDIPVIRFEIEERNQRYAYALVQRDVATPPVAVRLAMSADTGTPFLHVLAVHLADGAPYVIEDRWVNLAAVPQASDEPFDTISANEWLLTNAPYTHGEIGFSAQGAGAGEADLLATARGAALFVISRTTWDHGTAITSVRLSYAPGYRLHTTL